MFIDATVIQVSGGKGGDGCSSFRREKYVPRGGPDGGTGGAGGDVILRADAQLTTLEECRYHPHIRAGDGSNGRGKKQTGSIGKSVVCRVPVGTMVYDEANGELLADLVVNGQEMVAVHGGSAGRGNAAFTTPANPAPRRREKGLVGDDRRLRLELKILADLGLVGLPNAGKSTLLRAISAATPKVAPYPFTTRHPVLGVVRDELKENALLVADIPGLIEGAHRGRGMGSDFLRHVERTRIICHLVDALPLETLAERYQVIRQELELFAQELADKPETVALSKIDLLTEPAELQQAIDSLQALGVTPYPISSETGSGITALRDQLFALAATHHRLPAPVKPRVIKLPPPATISVESLGKRRFRVSGSKLERILAMTDFDNEEGLAFFQRLLERQGVSDRLREGGCCPGDTVVLGDTEFVFYD